MLVIDGHVLRQSGATLEYLEETRPQKPLLPTDPHTRALVRNVCGIVGCDIQPLQCTVLLKKISAHEPKERQAAVQAEWARHWIDRGFHALETELATTAGTYSVGDAVTLADLYVVTQAFNTRLMGVDMAGFPTIVRIAIALEALPAFQRAAPAQQIDAEA